jgi:hypothetical protein
MPPNYRRGLPRPCADDLPHTRLESYLTFPTAHRLEKTTFQRGFRAGNAKAHVDLDGLSSSLPDQDAEAM